MSRMMCIVSRVPTSVQDAIGEELVTAFASLARLHADGWGVARSTADGALEVTTSIETLRGPAELLSATADPAVGWMLYLRFASRAATPKPMDAQPFLAHRIAFQHNGALAPPEVADALLSDDERAALRGFTDSERYFALVRRHGVPGALPDAMRMAARLLRHTYPDACLNAMTLSSDGVAVVQSSGGRGAPHAAFAARGIEPSQLPPAHGDDYNRLVRREPRPGLHIVATPGLPGENWIPLPEDTVTRIAMSGATTVAL